MNSSCSSFPQKTFWILVLLTVFRGSLLSLKGETLWAVEETVSLPVRGNQTVVASCLPDTQPAAYYHQAKLSFTVHYQL